MKNKSGQVIIGAIVLLVVIALLVPAIITYIDNEAKWTTKEARTTRAFQLAETAVERGFQKIILSSSTWGQVQAGTAITDYNFDRTYTDMPGGTYQIKISSGPGIQAATITGVARDTSTKEIRAVRAVYSKSSATPAIYAVGGINLTGNPDVEWGPVISPNAIVTDHTHPRYYSAGSVSYDTNAAVPPNSDNIQWWSYFPNLPPPPQIDTQAYLAEAQGQGASHVYNSCPCTVSLGSVSGTYYFNGNTTFASANPKNYVIGNVIVMGDFNLKGNSSAQVGNLNVTLPSSAWREYGKTTSEWNTYKTWDTGAPAAFPGQTATYAPAATLPQVPLDNLSISGFLYVAGALSITGGGNAEIFGSAYLGAYSNLSGSHVTIWYDPDSAAGVKTKNVSLVRASWKEVKGCSWTTGNAGCPG